MYTILTDSCSDLNAGIAARFAQLEVLPLSYTISGQTSTQPFDDAARCSAFYDRLRAGEMCTTSQVSPGDFAEAFKAHAKKGEAVLGLIFSSALSGTYASACMARDMVLEEYPDAVIELVDTLSASAGEGMVVYDALLRRDAGMPIEENAVYTKAHLQEYAHWFTVDDLHFLKRGGRCSPSAAFFGTMLKIKPVLHVDSEGRLIARSKVRGRVQALRAIAMKFGELEADKDQVIFISHGDCEKDALLVKDTLVKTFGCAPEKIFLSAVGPVIGSHSGPGTVALFFRGKNRG
ncbi:MAG: DegV family protein [Christensenellales bacterium]